MQGCYIRSFSILIICGFGDIMTAMSNPSPRMSLNRVVDENRRLKQRVADLTLDNQALKLVLEKK